jgi:hypothetical protein
LELLSLVPVCVYFNAEEIITLLNAAGALNPQFIPLILIVVIPPAEISLL